MEVAHSRTLVGSASPLYCSAAAAGMPSSLRVALTAVSRSCLLTAASPSASSLFCCFSAPYASRSAFGPDASLFPPRFVSSSIPQLLMRSPRFVCACQRPRLGNRGLAHAVGVLVFSTVQRASLRVPVPSEGIEPPSAVCKTAALPLDEPGVAQQGVEP